MMPRRLTFQPLICYYCKEPKIGCALVEHLYGIYFCSNHKSQAEDDRDAYFDYHKVFPMSLAERVPELVTLLNSPFLVRGKGQPEWTIDYGYTSRETFIRYNPAVKTWAIPVIFMDNDRSTHLPITEFQSTCSNISAVIRILDAGVRELNRR